MSECQILCSAYQSCQWAIIKCPTTATCFVNCTGNYGCYHTAVHWSYNPMATSILTCPSGSNQCNLIQNQKY